MAMLFRIHSSLVGTAAALLILTTIAPCNAETPEIVVISSAESSQVRSIDKLLQVSYGYNYEPVSMVCNIIKEWRDPNGIEDYWFHPSFLESPNVVLLIFDLDVGTVGPDQAAAINKFVNSPRTIIGIGNGLKKVSAIDQHQPQKIDQTKSIDLGVICFGYAGSRKGQRTTQIFLESGVSVGLSKPLRFPSSKVDLPVALSGTAKLTSTAIPIARTSTGIPVIWAYLRPSGGWSYFLDIDDKSNIEFPAIRELLESIISNCLETSALPEREKANSD